MRYGTVLRTQLNLVMKRNVVHFSPSFTRQTLLLATVLLTGLQTALGQGVIAVTPASLDFGSIQVGTTSNKTLYVTNAGGGTLTGTASVSTPFSIVSGGSYSLAASQGQAVVVSYSPTVAGSNSAVVTFTGGGGATAGVIGAAYIVLPPNSYSFTNSTPITINDASSSGVPGAAIPYPLSITVAGLSGTLSNATVTLRGFAHTYPHDVGVLLVGPEGQKIVVMANSGSYAVANATYTFDDHAATGLEEYPSGPIVSGYLQTQQLRIGRHDLPGGRSRRSVCDRAGCLQRRRSQGDVVVVCAG